MLICCNDAHAHTSVCSESWADGSTPPSIQVTRLIPQENPAYKTVNVSRPNIVKRKKKRKTRVSVDDMMLRPSSASSARSAAIRNKFRSFSKVAFLMAVTGKKKAIQRRSSRSRYNLYYDKM